MKRVGVVIGCLLALATPLHAADYAQGSWGSGYHLCTVNQTDVWIAPFDVYLRRVEIWIGAAGGPVDIEAVASIAAPPGGTQARVVGWLSFDHYVAFTGIQQREWTYLPPFDLLIRQGQGIAFAFNCYPVSSVAASGQTGILFWYERINPA
jgi:hypothetical protein